MLSVTFISSGLVTARKGQRKAFQAPMKMMIASAEVMPAAGQVQFQTYCAVCHGPTGTGTGPVTATGAYPRLIPSLVTPRARALSDEYIYGIIWAGRGLMPAYGGRVPDRDRWLIVNYVRQLQEAAGAQAQPAPPTGR